MRAGLQAEIVDSQASPLEQCVRELEQEIVQWSDTGHLTDDLSILAIEIREKATDG